jgi:hypothetical protein
MGRAYLLMLFLTYAECRIMALALCVLQMDMVDRCIAIIASCH